MEFMSVELSGHSKSGIPLHSRNIIVLLQLCHSARSCIKIYPFCRNTTHSMSLYFTVITIDAIFVFGANRMRKIMLNVFRSVSVQVYGTISSRGLSLLRKVNGNMDSAKYQSDIIHDIEMTSECAVFPQKEYICLNNLTPCHNFKILEHSRM